MPVEDVLNQKSHYSLTNMDNTRIPSQVRESRMKSTREYVTMHFQGNRYYKYPTVFCEQMAPDHDHTQRVTFDINSNSNCDQEHTDIDDEDYIEDLDYSEYQERHR
jgi:hypothetical protein